MSEELRAKLKGEVLSVDAASLLPHHRRQALWILEPAVDLLDVALAIAEDRSGEIEALIGSKQLQRPELGQLADWCVDTELRFQCVILQPYVLAQVITRDLGKN